MEIDRESDFRIFQYKGEYVLYNIKGGESNHTHLGNYGVCKMLIKLICKEEIPRSDYLKESARRISRNDKYRKNILECL